MTKYQKFSKKFLKLKINLLTNIELFEITYKEQFRTFNNMIKLFSFLISIFLIIIIFLRIPKESLGLGSFKSDLLGSPASAEKSLNIFTAVGILIYVILAIQINLSYS